MNRAPLASALVLLPLLAVAGAPLAAAHEVRPAYLGLREEAPGEFSVVWKTPARGEMRLALRPEFSGATRILAPVVERHADEAVVRTWRMAAVAPLRGQSIRIAGLESTMTDALVHVEFADGTAWTRRLTPLRPGAEVPREVGALQVAGAYAALGVEHILTGVDHLLFVLMLILLTGGGWSLVRAVTAFTVSHGFTLTAATLGFVDVPPRPVEALIALSIAFVAAEFVRTKRGRPGVAAERPWIAAFAFGLLHGLGFAGGLSDAGLPAGHVPAALLSFSVGVEVGHLAFVAAVTTLIAIGRRMRLSPSLRTEYAVSYAVGASGMFWFFERTVMAIR